MRLHGKRALVTGGSDGIGLAIAEAFLREGADVLIVGRDAGKLEAARGALAKAAKGGAAVEALSADLATSAGIDTVVAWANGSSWPLDILVNNAGVAYLVPFETVSEDQFQHSFALNVTAAFFLTQRLLPRLGASASIINISSYFANKMIPKRPSSLYSLSKGALNSLTKSLAFELGPRGIRVNAIAPGTIDTAMRRKSRKTISRPMSSAPIRSAASAAPATSPALRCISPATRRHGPAAASFRSTAATRRVEATD